MPGDLIEAAAQQEAEIVQTESAAVVAGAAAQTAVLAAETTIVMANVLAAQVTQEAAEVIAENENAIEVLEGSLEWVAKQLENLASMNSQEHQEFRTTIFQMQEAIAALTLSVMESPSPIPPILETDKAVAVIPAAPIANPQNVDAADQRVAEQPVAEQRKKTKRFL